MRLIDADKIEFVLPRTLTEEEKNTYNLVIGKAFDNAPTVKAIPIEWIKKHYGWLTMAGEIIEDWVKENEKSGNSD